MTKFAKFIFCLVLLSFSSAWAKSPYNTTLDPNHAEEILARLANRYPIAEKEWLQILGDKKSEEYKVKLGDNLWVISKRLFGNPFLWRKLWEVNPELTNPHELTSGTILKLYLKGDRGLASFMEPEIRIPLVHLAPGGQGAAFDLSSDTIINVDIKNRFRPSFLVLTEEEKIYGEITGAFTSRGALSFHEPVYIAPSEETITAGEIYTIVHEEQEIVDRTQIGLPSIGTLCRVVGQVKLIEEGENLVRAEMTSVFGIVRRGDKLIASTKVVSWDVNLDPPNDLQTRIVMGNDPENRMFAQGQVVLLNKGLNEGMKEGFIFRVWRDTDPDTKSTTDVEPDSKGEVRVIYAGPVSSLGYILRNVDPLYIGDTLVPRQAFSNPLPPPLKNQKVLELE